MLLKGYCYQQGQSNKHPASLHAMQGGFLTLSYELGKFQHRLSEVKISDAVGQIPRSITFPNGWIFIATEQNQLNDYLASHQRTSWLAHIERSWHWIALAVLATILFVVGTYTYTIPWLTTTIAQHIPNSVYQSTGEQTLYSLDHLTFEPSQLPAERQTELQHRFSQLISQSNVSKHGTPQLHFRAWNNVPNAIALANGSVVVTDELVSLLQTNEQFDAIIYHELGHIHHEHVMKSLVKSSLVSLGLSLLIGDASNVADTISSSAAFVLMMEYSREMETQADEFAARQLLQRQGSVEPLIQAFTLLKQRTESQLKLPQATEWISSHPDTDKRIEHIRQIHL